MTTEKKLAKVMALLQTTRMSIQERDALEYAIRELSGTIKTKGKNDSPHSQPCTYKCEAWPECGCVGADEQAAFEKWCPYRYELNLRRIAELDREHAERLLKIAKRKRRMHVLIILAALFALLSPLTYFISL